MVIKNRSSTFSLQSSNIDRCQIKSLNLVLGIVVSCTFLSNSEEVFQFHSHSVGDLKIMVSEKLSLHQNSFAAHLAMVHHKEKFRFF